MLNVWAIVLISLYAIRAGVGLVFTGKGEELLPAIGYKRYGGQLVASAAVDGILFAGAVGAFG